MVRGQVRCSVVLFLRRNRCREINPVVFLRWFFVRIRGQLSLIQDFFCWFGNFGAGIGFYWIFVGCSVAVALVRS